MNIKMICFLKIFAVTSVCAILISASACQRSQHASVTIQDSQFREEFKINNDTAIRPNQGYRLLEILGLFQVKDLDKPISVEDIELEIQSSEACKLICVGLHDPKESESYWQDLENFTGGIGIRNEDGNGFMLRRETMEEPAFLTLNKSPCQLALGFLVPKNNELGKLKLRFADSITDVPRKGPEVKPMFTLTGILTSNDGVPVKGATVCISPMTGEDFAFSYTMTDDNYTLNDPHAKTDKKGCFLINVGSEFIDKNKPLENDLVVALFLVIKDQGGGLGTIKGGPRFIAIRKSEGTLADVRLAASGEEPQTVDLGTLRLPVN
jgi:hypothetical protein